MPFSIALNHGIPPIFTTTATSSFAARTWKLKAEQRTTSAAIAVRWIGIRIFQGGWLRKSLCEETYVILYTKGMDKASKRRERKDEKRDGETARSEMANGTEFRISKLES
jgi:hypothetical protein